MKRTDEEMEPVNRSIRLPLYVWRALDGDAERCRRSSVKQVEAILVKYYDLDSDIDLSETRLDRAAHAVSRRERGKTGTND